MIVAVVGPSGAGKDTLLAAALAQRPDLHLVRRVITRPQEAGGERFDGVSEAEFAHRHARGDFALAWQAHGLFYGIEKAQLSLGECVIFNGSRAGLLQAKSLIPDLRVVVVTAPLPVLAARLAARGREPAEDIEARLARANYCLPAGIDACEVVNDGTVEQGCARLLSALQPMSA